MAKTEMIRARIEPDLKQKAEGVLETLGMTPTEAITLFYKQVTLHHGLPFVSASPMQLPARPCGMPARGKSSRHGTASRRLKQRVADAGSPDHRPIRPRS